jgi:CO/xanthine dehydrogenase Mo-binding subunit
MTDENPDNKWIGKRTPRPDGADKVTGRAAYAADATMPGMIWGKVLRSPHAHARIKSIDTSKAEKMPGVKAVMTAKDIIDFPIEKGPVMLGIQDMRWMCRNVMAREKALFHGHPVAAVAASSERLAAEACKAIVVEYEVLPFVIDIDEARKPGAPILHDHVKFDGQPSNIAGTLEHKLGDVDAGFAEADVIVEESFKTEAVHQGYIEPHACVVGVTDGKATIWSSSQGQFMVRAMCSLLTGIPQSNIRAIPAEIGGGFGGKTIVYLEPVALVLARKTGLPVKIVMTREEVMRASGPTSGSSSTVKLGAKKDGTIVAGQGTWYLQAGGFPGSPIRGAAGCAFAPYNIPNVHAKGFDVVSNRSKVAAYRAPGAPIGAFSVESTMDKLARALKMDPVELRLKNAAKQGTKAAHGPVYPVIGYEETLRQALASDHYKSPLGPNQGRGIASGYWFNAGGESSAQVNITEDGNVLVMTGHPDIGGSRASTANIAAELLGIHPSRINVMIGDTNAVGFSNLTGGSRVTFASAIVVTQSSEKVIKQLCSRAAKIWKIEEDAVTWDNGYARPAGDNAGKFEPLSLAQIAAKASETGGPIGAGTQLNTVGAEGGFSTHVADVEVDRATGRVWVTRMTCFQDVGRAIHPDYVEGQLQGAMAQAIGWALSEEYIYNKRGQLDNAGFLDYRMPVASDLPKLECGIIEIPNPKHPQGVKGVGEVPLVPGMAAIANAVYDVLGIRFTHLPISPPKVLDALEPEPLAQAAD